MAAYFIPYFDHLLDTLAEYDVQSLHTRTTNTREDSIRFLEQRGFPVSLVRRYLERVTGF